MAIPFNLPSDEETENNYRVMEELRAQLFQVIRQIVLRQQQVPPPNIDNNRRVRVHPRQQRHSHPPQPMQAEVPSPAVHPLAEVVCGCHFRPQPRAEDETTPKSEMRDNWTQVGADLRLYADEFAADCELNPMSSQGSSSHKSSILMSLVPPSFRGPICMAVIILFGWRALRKAR